MLDRAGEEIGAAIEKHVRRVVGKFEHPDAAVERMRMEAMQQFHKGLETAIEEATTSFAQHLESILEKERYDASCVVKHHKQILQECERVTTQENTEPLSHFVQGLAAYLKDFEA